MAEQKEPGFWHLIMLMAKPKPLKPKDWVRPETQEEYEQLLDQEGFVVPSRWSDFHLDEYPTITADLEILEKYLLPVFWNFNQKSGYYQNRYHYYQRIFLVAALLTTLISVVNSYVHAVGGTLEGRLPFISPSDLNLLLGILTAVISARATYYTLLANYGEPRQRWAHYRRLTEEIRIMYFKFLAHLAVFEGPDRVTRLREEILNLRAQEQADG